MVFCAGFWVRSDMPLNLFFVGNLFAYSVAEKKELAKPLLSEEISIQAYSFFVGHRYVHSRGRR